MPGYRAALIGCGGMGRYHLSSLGAIPAVETVACCDIDPQRAARCAEEFGVPNRYTDYREMLAGERIDLVAIATQARQHRDTVIVAAESGVAGILCEKPMALDLAECDAMVEACERSGTRLAINHQAHCAPVTRRARQMLEAGEIGELLVMRALNKGNRKAGNELLEIGTHTFDRMLCFGGRATWAFAYLTCEGRDAEARDVMLAQEMDPRDRDDGLVVGERGFAVFGFAGDTGVGRPIIGESYFFAYGRGNSPGISGVELIGSKGQLAMRGTSSDRKLSHLPRVVSCAPDGAADWREITLPPMNEAPLFAGERPALDDGITLMYSELLHAIEQGSEHSSSGIAGRAAVEMAMAVYESHRRRARVDLPLVEREHPLSRWRRGE